MYNSEHWQQSARCSLASAAPQLKLASPDKGFQYTQLSENCQFILIPRFDPQLLLCENSVCTAQLCTHTMDFFAQAQILKHNVSLSLEVDLLFTIVGILKQFSFESLTNMLLYGIFTHSRDTCISSTFPWAINNDSVQINTLLGIY